MTSFGRFVAAARARGALVVQPRMGFSEPARMRAGLLATKGAVTAVDAVAGTLTIDSYTRVGDEPSAVRALSRGLTLNGYPISSHSPRTSGWVLDGIAGPTFPVQVRHGSARPQRIVAALTRLGLDRDRGRTRLVLPALRPHPARRLGPQLAADLRATGRGARRRSGAASGELRRLHARPTLPARPAGGDQCPGGPVLPPRRTASASRSATPSRPAPPRTGEAVRALRRLAAELLPDTDWHVVVYTYMGVYPSTRRGAHGPAGTLRRTRGAGGRRHGSS